MKNPFSTGQQIGEQLIQDGYLEATSLNSTNQHRDDARFLAEKHAHGANEEDINTVTAGIMQVWGQHKNWQH